MRLLKTRTPELEFVEFAGDPPLYAILSHTWGEGEVSLQDIQRGDATAKAGYEKIAKTREIAARDGLEYVWIDTCCIDKTNSVELSEAINSMYAWYQESEMCYVYLADLHRFWGLPPVTLRRTNRWFTRGWTLQELIAPSAMLFLFSDWTSLGTKSSLQNQLSEITGIPDNILLGLSPVQSCSVAQRMSWASGRTTTRLEDTAYCLMGIFGISMPMLYGEGDKAFRRLQEEIMKTSDDHSLFAWSGWSPRNAANGLLAASPASFRGCGNILRPPSPSTPVGAITLNSKGISLEAHWTRNGSGAEDIFLLLPCVVEGYPNSMFRIPLRGVSGSGVYFQRTGGSEACLSGPTDPINPPKLICVQHQQAQGDSLLWERAIRRGSKVVVGILLQRGIQPDSEALSLAASNGHEVIVRLLLESGAQPDSRVLSSAASNGHEAVVRLLLERGAQPDSSVLSSAAINGHEVIVRLLLERGTQPDSGVLYLATINGHKAVVRLLLESGTQSDSLALSLAALNGHDAIVRLLSE